MAVSERFVNLKSRVEELRVNMLPTCFSPTGEYSDQQLDMARGYRLLVHAEIESYIEDISRSVITAAVKNWREGKWHKTMISFLASYHSGWSGSGDVSDEEILTIAKSRAKKASVNDVIGLAMKQYLKRVSDNHGVRENNLAMLIIPTGIQMSELDPTWVTNLDNFGKGRGDIAHNSKSAVNLIDPRDELKLIEELMCGLELLDIKLSEIEVN
ncbi:HEPN domain-containing protein [Delftia sp. HK171]|uniref:HEPN domain-containing protein n=1 Tax=Delftia sp. HK171 TaxID=1920191 RepID=UPI000903D2A0|nr:HEPN domain-containing protein [Delftia sp. HK171]